MDYREQAEKISALLTTINKKIHLDFARHLESFGLTVPQMFVLRILGTENDLSISELSKRVGLTNSTVSGIVDRLEKEGYVQRQRDEKDRRVVYVKLTEKSRKLKQQIPVFKHDYFGSWIKELEHEKVEQIIESLSILARVLG